MSLYFDEACKLSYIARDVSAEFSGAKDDPVPKEKMLARLFQWEKERPQFPDPTGVPAPHILLLM